MKWPDPDLPPINLYNAPARPGLESGMHIPKGGMCRTCTHRDRDCSTLPFKDMRVISMCQDVSIVRCTDYQREDQESKQ